MTYEFRPAVREDESVIVIMAGPSGGGKTRSALHLARGLAGGDDKRIALINTEGKRGRHYAPPRGGAPDATHFGYLIVDINPPFSPDAYRAAVDAAAKIKPLVIIVDSGSHEWIGEGGCHDIHEAELDRIAGNEAWKRDKLSASAWRTPKAEHKRMWLRMLACECHLILCFRAEEKIKFVKVVDDKGREKTQIVPVGWQPICEKNMPYEATVSFMLSDMISHLPTPIKLQDQHAPFFPLDRPISERSGELLAAWARGETRGRPEAGGHDRAAASAGDHPAMSAARGAANMGTDVLAAWWKKQPIDIQRALAPAKDGDLKKLAAEADSRLAAAAPSTDTSPAAASASPPADTAPKAENGEHPAMRAAKGAANYGRESFNTWWGRQPADIQNALRPARAKLEEEAAEADRRLAAEAAPAADKLL